MVRQNYFQYLAKFLNILVKSFFLFVIGLALQDILLYIHYIYLYSCSTVLMRLGCIWRVDNRGNNRSQGCS